MNTIADVEATLKLTMAAPKMREALQIALPRIRAHWEELELAAIVTGRTATHREADEWFGILLLCEHAVQEARHHPGVIEMPRKCGL